MRKDGILVFSQKGPKHLEKKHGMDFNVCDDNIQDQGRLQNLVQDKNLEGVVVVTTNTPPILYKYGNMARG